MQIAQDKFIYLSLTNSANYKRFVKYYTVVIVLLCCTNYCTFIIVQMQKLEISNSEMTI